MLGSVECPFEAQLHETAVMELNTCGLGVFNISISTATLILLHNCAASDAIGRAIACQLVNQKF